MRDKFGRFTKGHPKPKNAFSFYEGYKHSKKAKKNISKSKKGNKNPMWKGGKRKTSQGYIGILKPTHPFCDDMGYVLEHRLIMEKQIGRYLHPTEHIHHINGKRNDNRLKNLKLFNDNSEHMKFHFPKGSIFGKNIHPSKSLEIV